MDSEKQKPITDEYRKNWERIYLQQEARKRERIFGVIKNGVITKRVPDPERRSAER